MPRTDEHFESRAFALAASAGLTGPFRLAAVPGGRNNRSYVLRAAGERAFLKAYFRHPGDPRDRLGAETALLAHAARLGIESVARVLAADPEHGLALFTHIEGRRLAPGELAWPHVAAAAAFYCRLNREGAALAPASEACFTLDQHLDCVDRRIDRLALAAAAGTMRPDAAAFVTGGLAPAWEAVRGRIVAEARKDDREPLAPALRRVSPSDFGFHNALLTPDGRLVFLDFEYAGLDDPAKMACDFFRQPEVPVPQSFLPRFLEAVGRASPDDAGLSRRVALLLPAYGIKWCCIMLNDFLPLGAARRGFATGEADEPRRDRQLDLARTTLNNILES